MDPASVWIIPPRYFHKTLAEGTGCPATPGWRAVFEDLHQPQHTGEGGAARALYVAGQFLQWEVQRHVVPRVPACARSEKGVQEDMEGGDGEGGYDRSVEQVM